MSRRRSVREWGEIVRRFEESGATRDAFCREAGISVQSLDSWRRKLRASSLVPAQGAFVEIELPPSAVISSNTACRSNPGLDDLVVELPYGVKLRFRGVRA